MDAQAEARSLLGKITMRTRTEDPQASKSLSARSQMWFDDVVVLVLGTCPRRGTLPLWLSELREAMRVVHAQGQRRCLKRGL